MNVRFGGFNPDTSGRLEAGADDDSEKKSAVKESASRSRRPEVSDAEFSISRTLDPDFSRNIQKDHFFRAHPEFFYKTGARDATGADEYLFPDFMVRYLYSQYLDKYYKGWREGGSQYGGGIRRWLQRGGLHHVLWRSVFEGNTNPLGQEVIRKHNGDLGKAESEWAWTNTDRIAAEYRREQIARMSPEEAEMARRDDENELLRKKTHELISTYHDQLLHSILLPSLEKRVEVVLTVIREIRGKGIADDEISFGLMDLTNRIEGQFARNSSVDEETRMEGMKRLAQIRSAIAAIMKKGEEIRSEQK